VTQNGPLATDPRNILAIHFGQLGDVILGLPALDALRGRFPSARITALTGTPADQIARLAGLADRVVGVNRHALKDAPKHVAVRDIVRLALALRRERFDAVVDFHAFYETGLLARFSGAPLRVGPTRENRSLRFAYTVTAPPEDRSAHLVERYLAIATAAGANARTREPRITPAPEDAAEAARRIDALVPAARAAPIVGLNPGAGYEARRWPGDRFAALGRALASDGARVLVFAGPEERGLGERIATEIGTRAAGAEGLTLGELAAVMRLCALVVSNDTGPAHIAAACGTPTLVLMPGNAGPSPFAVRGERNRLVYAETVAAISVEEALAVARGMLG
jgi:ADP-heptose:LPS heptosyltransferase